MKKLIAALLLVAGLCAGWFYASPLWTLKAMSDAAKAKDAATLTGYIDFPALKADVKGDLTKRFGAEIAKEQASMGGFGALLGGAIVDGLVDKIVSPAGLTALFALQAKRADGSTSPQSEKEAYTVDRIGLSEFHVQIKGQEGQMIFHRAGFGWKLAGIDLPILKDTRPTP
jgi:Protein of unknown function (DUF2939)